MSQNRSLVGLPDRGPLRTLFIITSMPVGGAETLLCNLIRRLDRDRFVPEVCCIKERGPLGEEIAREVPVHFNLLRSRYDVRVLSRLRQLIRERRIDAVVTVGAGDKMFWGRLAARLERVPVILSALHSTGWPDSVGVLNRLLTPITDSFIAVAEQHGRHLVERERFPQSKVCVIPNGVDVGRFRPLVEERVAVRREFGVPIGAPVCGIVAALRPEKNHALFLHAAALTKQQVPEAHFVIAGDGPQREQLEVTARSSGLEKCVHFVGSRDDIPRVLSSFDMFALTSHNEANPVSILEAMACGLPVASTRVGSIAETVRYGTTGYLVDPGDARTMAGHWVTLLSNPQVSQAMGEAGRQLVRENWSLERMVDGYQDLIEQTYTRKCGQGTSAPRQIVPTPVAPSHAIR